MFYNENTISPAYRDLVRRCVTSGLVDVASLVRQHYPHLLHEMLIDYAGTTSSTLFSTYSAVPFSSLLPSGVPSGFGSVSLASAPVVSVVPASGVPAVPASVAPAASGSGSGVSLLRGSGVPAPSFSGLVPSLVPGVPASLAPGVAGSGTPGVFTRGSWCF